MNYIHKFRLSVVFLVLVGVGLIVFLVVYALQQNINLFYTPLELKVVELKPNARIRVGGLVLKDSVQRGEGLQVKFIITDYKVDLPVEYNGLLPDLFKEGQGVVALGTLGDDQVFHAQQILAKHDENYMPPELAGQLGREDDAS